MSEQLKRMANEVGLEMVMPEVIPNSRRALEASEYAREQGHHEEFHRVVFRRFYGEGLDLHSWQLLRASAEEVGLDPDEMQRQTDRGRFKVAVEAQIDEARALGITGVPTYIFDEKYAIIGAQPYNLFRQTIARLLSEAEGSLAEN